MSLIDSVAIKNLCLLVNKFKKCGLMGRTLFFAMNYRANVMLITVKPNRYFLKWCEFKWHFYR